VAASGDRSGLEPLLVRDPVPGAHTIVSKVTDVNGQIQATPDQMPQKPSRWENHAQFPRTVMVS
jgi:hypothetical protein